MKKETLEKAKKIQAEIAELRKHFDEIFTNTSGHESIRGLNPYGFEYSKDGNHGNTNPLRNEFIPFPVDNFMKIYKANVEEKIALLEKEFETL